MSRWADGGPYIRMPSGRKVRFGDPVLDDFNLPDLAYNLSGINRFSGVGISVAQHMAVGAIMARRFYEEEPDLPLRFLIHDVAEAFLGDVSSPLKSLLPDFQALEAVWDRAVENWAGITFLDTPLVKELDNRMFLTERLVVYRNCPVNVEEDVAGMDIDPFPLTRMELDALFVPWHPRSAESEYLTQFKLEQGLLGAVLA